MIIERDGFKMESSFPDNEWNNKWFFDLSFLHIVNEGKPNEREEYKIEGYSTVVPQCIKDIKKYLNLDMTDYFKSLGLQMKAKDWSKYEDPGIQRVIPKRKKKK